MRSIFDILHKNFQEDQLNSRRFPGFEDTLLMVSNSLNLNYVDYSVWSIMQENIYQTLIANMDELKHWLVQVWAELDHKSLCNRCS